MIFNIKTKGFQTRSDKPNMNWTNDDSYIVIPDNSDLANKIIENHPNFECVLDENGNLIDVKAVIDINELKNTKLKELEQYIIEQKEQGFYYNDNRFKLDSVAQNRINMLATNVSLTGGKGMFPLQWFTANGENGMITLENAAQFGEWYANATMKILEIEQKEATYRFMVEQATTQEELDNIIFE